MPATESTWRNQAQLHRIFAVSGVVLTLATVWMFYKDHARPWKVYQPKILEMDQRMTLWRQEQVRATEAYRVHTKFEEELALVSTAAIEPGKIAAFVEFLEGYAKAEETTVSTKRLTSDADKLSELSGEAATARRKHAEALKELNKKPSDETANNTAAEAATAAKKANDRASAQRGKVVEAMRGWVFTLKTLEDKVLNLRKVKNGEIDRDKANVDIAIRDSLGDDVIKERQAIVDAGKEEFRKLDERYQSLAYHRKQLDKILKEITAPEDAAIKAAEDATAALTRLQTSFVEKRETYFSSSFPFLGKKFLNFPILDAFGTTRKIDNLWSKDLEQNYNFSNVRRFDRCTTCHQSMQKSLPGEATSPAFVKSRDIRLTLIPPKAEEIPKVAPGDRPLDVEHLLGIRLADFGLLNDSDVTVKFITPKSPAAKALVVSGDEEKKELDGAILRDSVASFTTEPSAEEALFPVQPGLMVGDVITKINEDDVYAGTKSPARVAAILEDLAQQGKPIHLTVRRGLPSPYTSHPRLDLYISDSSPHKLGTFACTICHEGQGSATEFKWASHTPNTVIQANDWTKNKEKNYGWFDNPHWIYPMYAKRFAESTCLKCHHEVVDLEPSERYPEAPAPKVVHGYHLIRKFGCFGCHEVNGFDGPTKRVGPDLRLEPNYFAVAQELPRGLPGRERHFEILAAKTAKDVEAAQADVEKKQKVLADLNQKKEDAGEDKAQVEKINKEIEAATAALTKAQELLAKRQASSTAVAAHQEKIGRIRSLARRLTSHPEDNAARNQLRNLLDEDAQDNLTEFAPTLGPAEHRLASLLKDVEVPGEMRKPGPSLRFVGQKLDQVFLYDWISNPKNFRESTRMPQFFGLWGHLQGKDDADSLKVAKNLEPIEVRGIMAYLNAYQQTFEPVTRPEGISEWSEEEQIARGKVQFETRGCLACHTHEAFPEVAKYRKADEIVQGPDLSRIGQKFDKARNPAGPEWLYSWIREPTRYHPRTVMPNLFLDKEALPKKTKEEPTQYFDPAGDIVAYLLSPTGSLTRTPTRSASEGEAAETRSISEGSESPTRSASEGSESPTRSASEGEPVETSSNPTPWKPVPEASGEADQAALNDLTLEYLNEIFPFQASEFLTSGIPASMEKELKGAEKELIHREGGDIRQQQLRYIGRKSIAKYGCYGCHDIPGFEDAKPIGTGLADWGRKDPSKLAFEHITHYLHSHGHDAPGTRPTAAHGAHGQHATGAAVGVPATTSIQESHAAAARESEAKETEEYFEHQLEAGSRIGFIYQKLKEPRSYDFEKTQNKRYNERLRMPQFPFTAEEREAVITFVLGLVAEPPRDKYLYKPSARNAALIEGKQVLEKFNCAGCHVLETEKWKISYAPGDFGPQSINLTFPFLLPRYSAAELAALAAPDGRNELHATLEGMPANSDPDGKPILVDEADGTAVEEGTPYNPSAVKHAIDLYRPVVLDGNSYITGQNFLGVSVRNIDTKYPATGGVLARYLVPRVTALEKEANPNAKGSEAWGWVPPPLVGEGKKVQSSWLHDFLLEPYPIRPAVFLRMPKFNMTSEEATAIVNYFAAKDNARYPYELTETRNDGRLARAEALYRATAGTPPEEGQGRMVRFDHAMKIVVDNNFCVKCHKVADFTPDGSLRAMAPNLADAYRRLKPDYMREWIAYPKMILPYTSMPVNIKYDPAKPFHEGVSQSLYHGTAEEQLEALVDLLSNFDQYARTNTNIAALVPPPPPMPPEGTTPPAEEKPEEKPEEKK